MIKGIARALIRFSIDVTRRTRIGAYRHNLIAISAMERWQTVEHRGLTLRIPVPNEVCKFRADTFSTKEPETLDWLDDIPSGSILWDIGANVGLYTVYAARKRQCSVYAFEPSVFNLELLARSINLNGVTDRVCLVPFALSDSMTTSRLRMTSTDWGGALSTFDQDFGFDGRQIRSIFEFQTLGLTMDTAVHSLNLPRPDYIKLDVDGIEHLILRGGEKVLSAVRGVLIEINDDFREQAQEAAQLLSGAGLVLVAKEHSELVGTTMPGFERTYNQIWQRDVK